MKTAVLMILILLLAGCDSGSSTTVNTSQASSQNQNTDGEDGACDANCTLECRPGGGFLYQLVCGETEAPTEVLSAGDVSTIGQLPAECLNRELPPCDADDPPEEE